MDSHAEGRGKNWAPGSRIIFAEKGGVGCFRGKFLLCRWWGWFCGVVTMRFLYAFVAFLAAFWRGRSGVGCLSAEIGLCAFRAGEGAGGHAADVAWPLRRFATGFLHGICSVVSLFHCALLANNCRQVRVGFVTGFAVCFVGFSGGAGMDGLDCAE